MWGTENLRRRKSAAHERDRWSPQPEDGEQRVAERTTVDRRVRRHHASGVRPARQFYLPAQALGSRGTSGVESEDHQRGLCWKPAEGTRQNPLLPNYLL